MKLHIYLDNNGNTSKNIDAVTAGQILEEVNDLFVQTGIQFYIADDIRFENDENWRAGITSFSETISFFAQEGQSSYLNIHFIDKSSAFGSGYAITPFYPSFPYSRWNCAVETQSRSITGIGTRLPMR